MVVGSSVRSGVGSLPGVDDVSGMVVGGSGITVGGLSGISRDASVGWVDGQGFFDRRYL